MEHVRLLRDAGLPDLNGHASKSLLHRATGSFYTHELIGQHLIQAVLKDFAFPTSLVKLIDPFCGDGRLVCWLLEAVSPKAPRSFRWQVELWDYDEAAVVKAQGQVRQVASRLGLNADLHLMSGDTFQHGPQFFGAFDIVVTNPPWEILKPDRRELSQLSEADARQYVERMRQQDALLTRLFPLSQPDRKFSGWGTNLARCGVEAALKLTAPKGVCGFVSPSSLLADQMSISLRRWLFTTFAVKDLAFFPAEARLFDKVDQPCITLVAVPGTTPLHDSLLTIFNRHREPQARTTIQLPSQALEQSDYVVSLHLEEPAQRLFGKWMHLSTFADLEGDGPDELWAGRELDETGHAKYLAKEGEYLFVKGRMIRRFGIVEKPTWYIKRDGPRIPRSADFHRLVWRDVSRPTQKRRIHAMIIPPGQVTGNSLNVAYYRDNDLTRLKALLGVVSSLVFEFQVRANLATGHISLGAVRKVRVPPLDDPKIVRGLASLVDRCCEKPGDLHPELETRVARIYGLSREEFGVLISSFAKFEPEEKDRLLAPEFWEGELETAGNASPTVTTNRQQPTIRIPNHFTPGLSELDLRMVKAVPPGGNWKDIPKSIPSERLAQIRESYANGEGSRSTYYGRLHPDAPSYTISTYFNRPGNGCHIHYDFEGGQHRVISQREAARLQGFPDSFVFCGNRGSVNKQIGNAVPPLLA
jgi:Alw26I/Eco31I/Esp3I family type II restriction m6 adenine DNA methyltransferase